MSHYKAMPVSATTRRAAGQRAESTSPDRRRHTLRKAILIIAIGLFAFMAASAVAML